jgi:dihydrofolate reductase
VHQIGGREYVAQFLDAEQIEEVGVTKNPGLLFNVESDKKRHIVPNINWTSATAAQTFSRNMPHPQ